MDAYRKELCVVELLRVNFTNKFHLVCILMLKTLVGIITTVLQWLCALTSCELWKGRTKLETEVACGNWLWLR